MAIQFSSLASGSSGNCQLIQSNQTTLLLDAGLTGKYITNALHHYDITLDQVNGILITHEHSDHISGLGVLHRKANLPIYISDKTWQVTKDKIGKINTKRLHFIEPEIPFTIRDIVVNPHSVSHDAVDPLCYTFSVGDTKIAIVTDLGIIDDHLIAQIKDASLVMLEANHNVEMLMMGNYPYPLKRRVASELGHLSNEDCAAAAIKAIMNGRVSTVLLGHLSKENNTPELAYETVKSSMIEQGMVIGKDVMLDLTYRNRIGNLYRLK